MTSPIRRSTRASFLPSTIPPPPPCWGRIYSCMPTPPPARSTTSPILAMAWWNAVWRPSRRAARYLTRRTSDPASVLPMILRVPGKPPSAADSVFTTNPGMATTRTPSGWRATRPPRSIPRSTTSLATTVLIAVVLRASARLTSNQFPIIQKNPAVSQYNLDVQHEFKGNNFLSVAYVGTAGRHLDTNRNLNQIPIPVVPTMNCSGTLAGGQYQLRRQRQLQCPG